MNPYELEEAGILDKLCLSGTWSPGDCKLNGHKRDQKYDVKDGDGQGGASSTWKGEKVAQFTVTFDLLYDPVLGRDDFAEWDAFLPILRRGMNGKEALIITHPDLVELDIVAVTVESLGGKVYDGLGGATVTVGFLEYRPPKPKTGTPKPKGSNKADPNADLKKEIDGLLNEAKKP